MIKAIGAWNDCLPKHRRKDRGGKERKMRDHPYLFFFVGPEGTYSSVDTEKNKNI